MRKPLHHHLQDYFFPHPRNNHRPHLFSLASVAVIAVAVVIFEDGYLVQTKVVFLETDFLAAVLPGALIALTNQDRAAIGLTRVTEDALLNKAAQAKAADMAVKGYFAHESPDGKTSWYWLNLVGYDYSYAGENLAVNFTDSENVEAAWMNSSSHRANIVKPQYTRVGIGVANGMYEGRETTFVAQFFATPAIVAVKKDIPKTVAIVEEPARHIATSAAPIEVLGSETRVVSEPVSVGTSDLSSPKLFARLLASPLNTLMTLFTILFAIIAIPFITAVLMRGKVQHPSVVFGGALLLVLIPGAMLLSAVVAGSVQVPPESAAASVSEAF